MFFEMSSFLCPQWDDVVRDDLVLVQEGNLACTNFPAWWDDVVRDALVLVQKGNALAFPYCGMMLSDALVLVQEGKLACTIFSPQ
jgi:hypothetical protein